MFLSLLFHGVGENKSFTRLPNSCTQYNFCAALNVLNGLSFFIFLVICLSVVANFSFIRRTIRYTEEFEMSIFLS